MLPWVLFIVLLSPVPGLESLTKLNDFATYEECKVERDRIGFEMAEAYPYEADFRIECREWKPRGTPINNVEAPPAEYAEILKTFAKNRYPKQVLTIKVTEVKILQSESGNLPIQAVQIHVSHNEGTHSFILLLKGKVILGWIDAGDVEEDEEEEEELFPGKEFA